MRKKLKSVHEYVVTVGGIGLLPIMPGTWCSAIVAIPALLFATNPYLMAVYLVSGILLAVIGIFSVKAVQGTWGTDPTEVVIDEAVGMCLVLGTPIAYVGAEYTLGLLFLFRVFDVMKPWPISWINNRKEAWSVIIDDVIAAVFAVVTMYLGAAAFQVVALFFAKTS